jgi:alpha-mannosidase
LQGSYIGSHTPQHCIDLSEASYGVTFAAPDVYAHSFGALQTSSFSPSTPPTIFSKFIRYGDQCRLKNGSLGTVVAEPGASPRWDVRYALRAHARAIDLATDARFGWEVSTPLIGRVVPAATGAKLTGPVQSLLSLNVPNIIITDVKQADFGAGIIVKLQEISKTPLTNVVLSSEVLTFSRITATTPLESDVQVLFQSAVGGNGGVRSFAFPMTGSEIKTLRVEYTPGTSGISEWELFR